MHMISIQGLYKHCIDGAFVFFNAVWSYFCFLLLFLLHTQHQQFGCPNSQHEFVGFGGGRGLRRKVIATLAPGFFYLFFVTKHMDLKGLALSVAAGLLCCPVFGKRCVFDRRCKYCFLLSVVFPCVCLTSLCVHSF